MDGTGSIRCVNCGKALGSGEAKFFADVLVCENCEVVATRIFERGTLLLRRMAVLLRDTLKWTLAKGKLRLPSGDIETVSDAELLEKIVGIHAEQAPPWQTTATPTPTSSIPSTKSSEPDVEPADSNRS